MKKTLHFHLQNNFNSKLTVRVPTTQVFSLVRTFQENLPNNYLIFNNIYYAKFRRQRLLVQQNKKTEMTLF